MTSNVNWGGVIDVLAVFGIPTALLLAGRGVRDMARSRRATRDARARARRRHPSSQGRQAGKRESRRQVGPEWLGYGQRIAFGPEWRRIAEAEGLDQLLEEALADTEGKR